MVLYLFANPLKRTDDQVYLAKVELGCRDWNDQQGRQTECRVKLSWSEGEIEEIDWNFFEAFKQVRQKLETLDLLPLCYGASRQIVFSGMLIDWDLGLSAYRVGDDGKIIGEESIFIFDTGDDVEPVSVENQAKFQNEWVARAAQEIG